MFWDKGYTPSQNIESLLEKENTTVEEFLDDDDILLECRSQKKSIVNYFTRPDVIKRLVELIITEPSDDLPMAQRFRYANMACEILTLGLSSLDEKLLSDADTLKTLYSYLENEPPLNPLLSSFFSKTFSMLFTKKAEQDWFLYQQMCLKLLEYIKSQNNFLDLICKHFTTPIIPDLIMQMMKNVEGGQLKRNLYEWLTEDKLVDRLIAILGNPQEADKHANVAEFLCDLIQQGRSMRQTDEENDSFEPAFTGSNPILKTIESEATIEALLNVILEPNAQESAIVSGISVVLTLIRPIVFVDEPDSIRMTFIHKREKDIHEQILTTVIRVIAPRLKDFNELLKNPPNKPEVMTTAAKLSPPFGMTRLQICRIFTVLLQTKNEEISKAICETDFFKTLLALFKQYCWNNFLHSEVEKCLQLIFYTQQSNNNNSTQGSTIANDGSFGKSVGNIGGTSSFLDFVFKLDRNTDDNIGDSGGVGGGEVKNNNETNETKKDDNNGDIEMSEKENKATITAETTAKEEAAIVEGETTSQDENKQTSANEMETDDTSTKKLQENANEVADSNDNTTKHHNASRVDNEGESNENDTSKVQTDTGPSALQTHVIVHCKLISILIDCWQHNKDMESAERGRRLGYMGHLIKIFKHITNCISKSEHIGALIESNLSDASELELWQSIINPNDGDFTKALATQSKMLANCNAHEAGDYSQPLPKEFLSDNSTLDYFMSLDVMNNLGPFSESGGNQDNSNELAYNWFTNVILKGDNAENDLYLQFGPTIEPDEDDEDDENTGSGDGGGHSLFGKSAVSTSALQAFGVTNNPWDNMDPFSDLTAATATTNSNSTPWAADFGSDNFADFDSHFSSFTNDLGESLVIAAAIKEKNNTIESKTDKGNGDGNEQKQTATITDNEIVAGTTEHMKLETTGYDNNANVEKTVTTLETQEIGKFADDDTDHELDIDTNDVDIRNEKALPTSLVRTLQSVMQDSEDDYEDDEGMWTKPLGGSVIEPEEHKDADEEQNVEKNKSDGNDGKVLHTVHSVFTNGPSSKPESTDIKQLNATNAETDNATTTTTTTTTSTSHSNDSMNLLTDNISKRTNSSTSLDAIADVACNTTAAATATSTATNAVEIAPTTT